MSGLKKLNEVEQIQKSEQKENLPENSFTEADFWVHWKKYIEILDKQGEKMLSSILNAAQPKLVNTTVRLTFPNAMMLEEVRKNQSGILNYLRKNLHNHLIAFDYILNEAAEKTFIYTPQEKYQKLHEINPLIAELRKIFELDI